MDKGENAGSGSSNTTKTTTLSNTTTIMRRCKVRLTSVLVKDIRRRVLQEIMGTTILNNGCGRERDVYLYDGDQGDYISLNDMDDTKDLVASFGKRLRLQLRVPLTEESSCMESNNGVLAIQGRHLGCSSSSSSGTDFRFAVPNTDSVLVLQEEHNQPNTTAFTVWDGSILLANYLALGQWVDDITDRIILELGAGCGLCGLTGATLGARKVILTDLPNALPVVQVERNRPIWQPHCANVECHALDWFQVRPIATEKNEEDDEEEQRESYDNPDHRQMDAQYSSPLYPMLDFVDGETSLVLVADCVWTMELLPPLLNTLRALLRILPAQSQDVTVLISYQQRGAAAHRAFHQGLQDLFGHITPVQPQDYGIQTSPVLFLYECKQ